MSKNRLQEPARPLLEEAGRGLVLTCPWCGYTGKFQRRELEVMAVCVTIALLFFLVIPAIIYALWYGQQEECPNCRAKVPRGPF